MGKILYLDPFSGIAGDMMVAALIDAGLPPAHLEAELRKLPITGWKIQTPRAQRGAFSAQRFIVLPDGPPQILSIQAVSHDHSHGHSHGHGHGHSHDHSHDTGEPEWPGQPDRRWSHIRALLTDAPLAPRVRSRALRAFQKLAEAEARVHGMSVEDIAFHEVGSVDSIIDIVGACIALEYLEIDRIICGPLPMGAGTTRSAHGLIPLPAPATLELLKNFPIFPSEFPGEHVTPTGAALVAGLAEAGPLPAFRVQKIGYGAGQRNPQSHANVLRAVIGEGESGSVGEVLELQAQVDDLTGEALPPLLQALLNAGAIDAFSTPVLMKKGRSGLLITALCAPADRVAVGDALLRHSGSFGYRWQAMPREVLARHWEAVETPWGSVRLKIGMRGSEQLHSAPEYEDCQKIATAQNLPITQVYAAALSAWAQVKR